MITDYVQIGTLLIGIATAWLLILTFRRDRKYELENQLYKTRLDALSNIAFEINNFFNLLDEAIVQLELLEENSNQEFVKEKIIELSLYMDKEINKCQSELIRHSVYFTDEASKSLLEFTNNLDGKVALDDESPDSVSVRIEKYYDQQLVRADKAITELRNELQLDKLHSSLFQRLK